MSVPTVTVSVSQKYNKTSKYKELEIEIDKTRHLKTTKVPKIVGALCMMRKWTNKYINKISFSANLSDKQNHVLC